MNKKILAVLVAALALSACGGSTNSFKFESGTYTISGLPSATAGEAADQCGMFAALYRDNSQDVKVEVADDEKTLTIFFADKAPGTEADTTKGAGTVDADAISALAEKDFVVSNSCSTHWKKAYTGTLTADNAADVTVNYDEQWSPAPSVCTAADTTWTTSCHSTISFKIAKQEAAQ